MIFEQNSSYIKNTILLLIPTVLTAIFLLLIPQSVYASTGVINGSVINVRSGPGSTYMIDGNLYQDTEVQILDSSAGWYKIQKGSLTGWVSASLLQIKQEDKVQVIKELVNLRSGPSTSYGIVAKAEKGDILTLLGSSGDWFKVQNAAGQTCYIASYLVKTIDAGSSSPAEPDSGIQIQVNKGPINIRSGPDSTYEKTGMIGDNEVFSVIVKENDWYKIRLSDGSSAWAAGWLVSEVNGSVSSEDVQPPVSSSQAPVVYIDGKKLSFDVAPIIENGRTLVPLRAIFEAMGASVEWNNATRTVTARKGNTNVVLPIGSTQPRVNGQDWPLDVPAKIVQDRTLAPLRFVGEAFGGKVAWNGTTRTVTIASSESVSSPSEPVNTVLVSKELVNLRDGPSTAHNKVASAEKGEKLAVLADQDGWYQVSRGGTTAWVASWVVNVAWEENEPINPVTDPEEEETNETLTPSIRPPVLGDDEMWLSIQKSAEGIKLKIESGSRIYADIDENGSQVTYDFTRRKILNAAQFSDYYEMIGSEKAYIQAKNEVDRAVLDISLPQGIEDYRTMSEDGGKREIFLIPNRIVKISREVAGDTGDNIIIYTMTPCEYESTINNNVIEVRLLDTVMGVDRNEYKYSISPVLKKMTISQAGIQNPITKLKIETDNMGDYQVFQTEDDNALNIMLTAGNKDIIHRDNVVVIDPGHGGRDPGAVGSKIKEKDVNLIIAKKVGDILENKGINVEYTRTTDVYVGLLERCEIANDLNAELFVSIHNNSIDNSTKQGTETYYCAPIDEPQLFRQKAERASLAKYLQDELIQTLKRPNRGVKQAEFTVLKNTEMPSALVEIAFISNPEEQDLLMSSYFQNLAAKAIAEGIMEYLEK